MFNLIKFRKDIFTSDFHRIIYCQPPSLTVKNQEYVKRLKSEFPNIELCEGLPNIGKLNLDFNILPALILIDDMMGPLLQSEAALDLVTKFVHHFNISVCFSLQNYYCPSKYGKTLIKNCHYRIFFYTRIEQRELSTISSQIANAPNFFQANFQFLFEKFPNDPSHYLLIDGHSRSKMTNLWCRTHIFPTEKGGEITPIFFFPNPDYNKK